MAGRFAVYTDADIHGPVVDALLLRRWDLVRAVDVFPEATDDLDHFEEAMRQGRVLVSNDSDVKDLAERRLAEGRTFPGVVWWPRRHYQRMSVSDIVEFFDHLAQQDEPFAYPVIFLKPNWRTLLGTPAR